jgi:hypothetical protein
MSPSQKRSLCNADAHQVTLAKALQLTGMDCDTIISAPSIQLEFEMPYRFEFSTSLRNAFARGSLFCCPMAAAILLNPAAMAQTAAPSATAVEALPAHRVVIDPMTGRVRMAEPNEMPAAAPSGAAPNASGQTSGQTSAQGAGKAAVSGIESHPAMKRMQSTASQAQMGAGVRRFDASSLQFSVVKRDADGKLSTECVHGDEAAHNAVHSKATGARHDH